MSNRSLELRSFKTFKNLITVPHCYEKYLQNVYFYSSNVYCCCILTGLLLAILLLLLLPAFSLLEELLGFVRSVENKESRNK